MITMMASIHPYYWCWSKRSFSGIQVLYSDRALLVQMLGSQSTTQTKRSRPCNIHWMNLNWLYFATLLLEILLWPPTTHENYQMAESHEQHKQIDTAKKHYHWNFISCPKQICVTCLNLSAAPQLIGLCRHFKLLKHSFKVQLHPSFEMVGSREQHKSKRPSTLHIHQPKAQAVRLTKPHCRAPNICKFPGSAET